MTTIPAGTTARAARRSLARAIGLCVIEARPIVICIFGIRFAVAYALTMATAPPQKDHWRPVLALVAWLLATGSVYLFDGVTDTLEDRLNGSTRPIARGALAPGLALSVSVVWAVLALAGAAVLGAHFVVLVALALGLGYAYAGPGVRLKRWSPATSGLVLGGGLLTFAAGGWSTGAAPASPSLVVFAVAMSAWMAGVGALAKDFGDATGDALAGRRTHVVVGGARRASWRLSACAAAVATGFAGAAWLVDTTLIPPAGVVSAGTAGLIAWCLSGRVHRGPRVPYQIYMVTQYLAHAAVLVKAVAGTLVG